MLREYLNSIADKLREKLGTSDKINAQVFTDKIDEVYDAGYAKGAEEGGGGGINPEWTDWRYFSYYNNRNDLVAKLKHSDTSNGTNFSNMFYSCSQLTAIPLIDTSNGTNFSNMFYSCSQLTAIPPIDTSNGTNFASMFQSCSKLTTIPLIDTSNGTSFGSMFQNCSKLTAIPPIDTSNGTNFSYMFQNCSKLTAIPPIDTSSGTSFSYMFQACSKLTTIPPIDTSNGTNFGSMFFNCTALENVTFEGTFNVKSNISVFSSSPNLTVDSLMSFINALNNTGTGTYTVTIGSINLAKLTAEQIQIATAKNITLA